MPDHSKSVLETAQALVNACTGSGDDIPDAEFRELTKWLHNRVEFDWEHSTVHTAVTAYENAVRYLARAAVQVARLSPSYGFQDCPACKGKGYHVGDCHPQEPCGPCNGLGAL